MNALAVVGHPVTSTFPASQSAAGPHPAAKTALDENPANETGLAESVDSDRSIAVAALPVAAEAVVVTDALADPAHLASVAQVQVHLEEACPDHPRPSVVMAVAVEYG